MLSITIQEREFFNEATGEFIKIPKIELKLEHSLISLSRWESKWKKPFLSTDDHTKQEILDYIACMSIDKSIDPQMIEYIDVDSYKKIINYIGDPCTATKVYDRRPNRPTRKNEIMTSEVIYYYMIYYGIPFSCEKWHLNRLLMLIRVCGVKGGTTSQAMDMNAIFAQNRALNASRRGK